MSKTNLIILLIIVIIIGVAIPVLTPNGLGKLSLEEENFGAFALRIAKTDAFENPILRLLIFRITVARVEKINDSACLVYDQQGNDILLFHSYQATAEAKTFFGLTIRQAVVDCGGGSRLTS